MPHIEQRRQLKPADALSRLEPASTDIYTRTHLEKYLHRDSKVLHMTTKEYFLIYILNFYSTGRYLCRRVRPSTPNKEYR